MFYANHNYWKEDNCKTISLKCPNCGNTTEHFVIGGLNGFSLGLIFIPQKYHIGKKQYALMCPICNNISKLISSYEKDALKLQ